MCGQRFMQKRHEQTQQVAGFHIGDHHSIMLLGYTRPIPNMLYNTSYYKILRHGFQEHVQVCINFQELQRGMEPPRMTLGMNFAYYTITEPNSWNLQTAKLGNNLSFPFQLSLFIILYCFRLFFFFLFYYLKIPQLHGQESTL